MKKIALFILLVGMFPFTVSAGEFTGTVSYTGSSKFNQVDARLLWQYGINWLAGLEARYADEEAFKDPIYTLKVPVGFTSDVLSATVTPFYYFKNTSDATDYQAFGMSGQFVMTLEDDAVNERYSHAYVTATFARQQGTRFFKTGNQEDGYYSQAAYTLGLHKNFFRTFSFEVAGTGFQYPDGITDTAHFRGILNQQDLASLHSFDIVHELPKYTAATRLTWIWPDRLATFYVGYRFGEFYTAESEHSLIVGNSFAFTKTLLCDVAYNHLQDVHNQQKRDIFYAELKFKF